MKLLAEIIIVSLMVAAAASVIYRNLSRTLCSRCRTRAPWRFEWRDGLCDTCRPKHVEHLAGCIAFPAVEQFAAEYELSADEQNVLTGYIKSSARAVLSGEEQT